MNAIASWIGKYCLIAAMLGTAVTEVAAQGLDSFPVATKHSLAKRMDLEMCLVRFDVHLNTIIRTEESRSMGATFLDDADVNSREQCLRLCCETENCDVFVFEEKNQGTCFLFNCGPPSNFYCKFTHHSNYTSAVLKLPTVVEPPPPIQPLVSQIHSLAHAQQTAQPAPPPPPAVIVPKLSQHELELVNLKAPKSPARTNSDQTTTTLIPPLGVQLGQLPPQTSTTSTPRPSTPAQCGHYEFPCHSGECIAVYNACDGIPQCADGSDEGPECRRPAVPSPAKTVVQSIPVQQQQQQPLQRPVQMPIEQMPGPKQMFQQDLQQQELRGLQQIHNREDPMTAPKPWPRPLGEMPPSYIDTPDSRIFNHKGGLQIQSNISPPQYPDSIPDTSYIPNIPRTNQYMPLPGSYQSGPPQQQQWDPRMSPPQRPIWPQQMPQSIQGPIPQPNQPQQQQLQPIATPAVTNSDQSKQPAETPKETPSGAHKTQKSSEEYETYDDQYPDSKATSGEDQDEEKPAEKQPEPQQQKKKQHKHRKHGGGDHEHDHKKKNKSKTTKKDKAHDKEEERSEHAAPPVHEHLKMLRSDLEIEFADHDGQAERPGGAVLSLTLGAILTAALAIMIGCRMKVARRRIRRQGKSSYAHDADFLVNGMYL